MYWGEFRAVHLDEENLPFIDEPRNERSLGGTILPKSNTLIPSPFPKFMDQEWPNVLGRISETGVYKEFCSSTATTSSDPLERGPNHVNKQKLRPFFFPVSLSLTDEPNPSFCFHQ
jgi:hypothetical protein